VQCTASDDPWPLGPGDNSGTRALRAFFNSNRDFFTGITVPAPQAELPAFYSALQLPRPGGDTALLLTASDNRVVLLEKGQLRLVTGTRDWGSDLAVLATGCGPGTQVVASSANQGDDSIRAFNITGTDAALASEPLPVNGSVVALWTADDAKTVFATIRHPGIAGTAETYEVNRVTATCN